MKGGGVRRVSDGFKKKPETDGQEPDPLATAGMWRVPDLSERDQEEEEKAEPGEASGDDAGQQAPQPESEPDSFTQMFEAGPTPLATESGMPAASPEPQDESAEPAGALPSDPDELGSIPTQTMMPPPPETGGTPPAAGPAETGQQTAEPGDFTRMFDARGHSLPTEAGMPAAQAGGKPVEPGEFTSLFQSPKAGSPQSGRPKVNPAKSSAPPSSNLGQPPSSGGPPTQNSSDPGDFTRFFQPSLGSGSLAGKDLSAPEPRQATPEPPKPPPSAYTRLFKASTPDQKPVGSGSGATSAFSADLTPETAPEPVLPDGPSEFTMVIQSSDAQAPAEAASSGASQTAAGDAAAEPAKKSKLPMVLIIVLSVLVIALIGVVLYLTLTD